ncbi:hypothetical protein JQX13_28545 [Archangium violaceum]|uniref:hypothetical protein n=1 Tax=Archangium violaceum TaxID=83451 RepID=UPI00193C5215|nr:hypothetical protein [Archangium violaceum]QRK04218.1 hypothetical protein JQX13_28545 [Archangium violaceum]
MSPMPWRGAVMAVVLSLCGCNGAAGGAVLNAALNTGIALGASAASRSSGGCYASCPVGTTCNKATGLCDQIPCRGECDPFEECIEERLTYRCVARGPANGTIIVNPSEQKPAEPQP